MTPSEPSLQQVPPPVALHRLMSGHWIAQAIFVAAQLGGSRLLGRWTAAR
jgi:hypothetical protein